MSDSTGSLSSPQSHVSIAELVRRLAEAEAALTEALGGPVDAIVDPDRATPILLVEAQEALRESEARYHRLITRIAAVVIEMDPDGVIQFVNDAASTVTGYRPDELFGQRAQDVLFPGALRQQIDGLFDLFRAGDVTEFELMLAAKDGRQVILEFNSANQYRADGTLEKIVGLGVDITQRKQAEQELDDYRRHLENQVEQRTVQLQSTNEALLESEERYRLAARATQDVIWDWNLETDEVHWNIAIASHIGYLEALKGTGIGWWRDRIHPQDRDQIIHSISEVIAGSKDFWSAEYRFRKADGDYAYVLDRGYVGYNEDHQPVRMVSAMFDATALRQAEAAEREQRRLAEVLREIALKMISVLDLPDVLDSILSGIERVVFYDTADLILIEEGGSAYITESRGYEKYGKTSPLSNAPFAWWEYPLLQQMVKTRRPVIVPDIRTCADWVQLVDQEWRRSYIGVPILLQDDVIGFFNLVSTQTNYFTPAMGDRLQLVAHQAALAVQSARLHQQARSAAATQERERLARDLHDAVSQSLFSASMIAEALQHQWKKIDPDRVDARLDQLLQLTRGAQAEMRTLLLELRPTALLEAKLEDLLPQLVTAIQSRKQIDIGIQLDDGIDPPPDVKICLYRIAQESLNNVIKHSGATQALVRLHLQQDQVELKISDNGQGFDPAGVAADSFGLKMMSERAEAVGAQVTVTSALGQGTHVNVLWVPPPH
jgi:PAS domain S-box-containing protein